MGWRSSNSRVTMTLRTPAKQQAQRVTSLDWNTEEWWVTAMKNTKLDELSSEYEDTKRQLDCC